MEKDVMRANELPVPFVIVATKGRPKETYVLLDYLARQSLPANRIMVVGSEEKDIIGLASHALVVQGRADILLAPRPGLTIQRNVGLDALQAHTADLKAEEWFVVFFDDDFRPADDWLENCAMAFRLNSDLVGVGGAVLGDGVGGQGLSEQEAVELNAGRMVRESHTWSGERARAVGDLYGCNMALRGNFASAERFDENLPSYGWQEDVDYTRRALRMGALAYIPECRGVHLGVQGGRTSGVRFGYSQVANPFYLIRKGSVPAGKLVPLMCRNVVSNIVRTVLFNNQKDYKGRLYGNCVAFFDVLLGRCHPLRIQDMN